jgi:hypothetical protein
MVKRSYANEHTFQRFALSEIGVVTLREDACFVASHDSLQKTCVDLNIPNELNAQYETKRLYIEEQSLHTCRSSFVVVARSR